jgi:hypothetical protein
MAHLAQVTQPVQLEQHAVGLRGIDGLAQGLAADVLARHELLAALAQPLRGAPHAALEVGRQRRVKHRPGMRVEVLLPQAARPLDLLAPEAASVARWCRPSQVGEFRARGRARRVVPISERRAASLMLVVASQRQSKASSVERSLGVVT